MSADEAIKVNRQEMKLSDLYGKMIDGTLSENDQWMIATILKRIALYGDRAGLIFSETHYVNLQKREDSINF